MFFKMKRRKFIYQTSAGLGGLLPVIKQFKEIEISEGPFFSTGIKIGEVTASSAIIWLRLTGSRQPVSRQSPVPRVTYFDETTGDWHPQKYFKEKYKQDRPDREVKVVFPDGYDITNIGGAAPGSNGEVRLLYKKMGASKWNNTNWVAVEEQADYSIHISLIDLEPGAEYEIEAEAKAIGNKTKSASIKGRFKTSWNAEQPHDVQFMVTTCHEYNHQDDPSGRGFKIYKHMQAMHPDFLVHTGDVLYYDHVAKSLPLAKWSWQRMFGLANAVHFYRNTPCYFMKDDHDTWMNDCYPESKNKFMGQFTFQQGVQLFKQQVPMSDKPYRTFRWGKALQVWLMEVREYRSANAMQDGPQKSIWGKAQMEWFKRTFSESDADCKILISPTPIVGPDRPQKKDNHANIGFAYEGKMIREFVATHPNTFIICGDRHWQYVSQDKTTGLMEFSCGPASNEHASGWNKEDVLPEHHYLNIVGGFLGVEVKPNEARPEIVFTHYGVDGEKLYSKRINIQ